MEAFFECFERASVALSAFDCTGCTSNYSRRALFASYPFTQGIASRPSCRNTDENGVKIEKGKEIERDRMICP